jgi:hypothetical protein
MVRRFRKAFYATREQLVYAAALDVGMKAGLAIVIATFATYVFGILDPHVPFDRLPEFWGLSVYEYLDAANVPWGWQWLELALTGDYLNFVGIAFLSGVTIVCYARILLYPLKNRDYAFAGIIVAQIVVLLLAASGLLVVGH